MKKGFTLIELLAVIVILAIIALIATPIVLNIIDDSKKSAAKVSAENYRHGLELAFARKMGDAGFSVEDGMYEIMEDGNVCLGVYYNNTCSAEILKVEMDGESPNSGTLYITKGSVSRIVGLQVGNYKFSNTIDNSSMTGNYEGYDTWDGSSATSLANLEKDDVAKTVNVNSAADLAGVRDAINSGNLYGYKIILNTSIDLNEKIWEPIGKGKSYKAYTEGDAYFTGSFDGRGHTISGLKVFEEDGSNGVGLFGAVVGNVTIGNLNLEGVVTSTGKTAGGLIGFAKDYNGITNVTVKNVVIDVVLTTGDTAGGILSRIYTTGTVRIEGCKNIGDITSTVLESGDKVGGLIGFNSNNNTIEIINSQNDGNIVAGSYAGGAIAYASYGIIDIKKFLNNGNITTNNGNVSSNHAAGGIIGLIYSSDENGNIPVNATISDGVNNGSITAIGWVGGIIGRSARPVYITNNINNGTITGAGETGGIIGCIETSFTVINCTNNAKISSTHNRVGGLVGAIYVQAKQDAGPRYDILIKNNNGGNKSIISTAATDKQIGRIVGCLLKGKSTLIEFDENTGLNDLQLIGYNDFGWAQ